MTCLANNGRGVHILKTGSKRRRTQAEMKEQLAQESIARIEAAGQDDESSDKDKKIEELEKKLEEMARKVEEGNFAISWVNNEVD